jgi:hypothetical protein
VQQPSLDAWPVEAGLVVDMMPNLAPDGPIGVSDNDVIDCARWVAPAASLVDTAAWTAG